MVPSSSRLLTCGEYGFVPLGQLGADDPLFDDEGRLRITDEALKTYVSVDFKNGVLRVQARGYVGLFEFLPGVHLQVRPRFPVSNFTRMVAACGYQPAVAAAVRSYATTAKAPEAWLSDVVADAFLDTVDVIRERGLLREYTTRHGFSPFPRGQLDAKATIRLATARGVNHAVEYQWHERTIDNGPNRVIKAAALRLHHWYAPTFAGRGATQVAGVRKRVTRIAGVLQLLSDANDERHLESLYDPWVQGLAPLPEARPYYRGALDLARAILLNHSLDLDDVGSAVHVPSLVINSEDLFETYVRESLQAALRSSPTLEVLDGNHPPGKRALYEPLTETFRKALPADIRILTPAGDSVTKPDLLFRAPDGTFPLVGDVKYTPVDGTTERGAVEQVVLYAVRYGSPVALTIHPRSQGTTTGLHVAGRIGDITVAQYRVDLDAPDLEREVAGLASAVQWLATTPLRT